MVPCSLLILKDIQILEQLHLEEDLLKHSQDNWCILNFSGFNPSIIVGISENHEEKVNIPQANTDNIPIIRRFSGGGTVLLDQNSIVITWIFNPQDLKINSYPEPFLRYLSNIYKNIFKNINFSLVENDFCVDNKKIGGNALSIKKGRCLLHTSFLWSFNEKEMSKYLPLPLNQPKYRFNRSHDSFLCKINKYFKNLDHLQNDTLDIIKKEFIISEKNQKDYRNSAIGTSKIIV